MSHDTSRLANNETACMQALDGHALQTPFALRADARSLRDAEPRAGSDIERTERIACTIAPAEVGVLLHSRHAWHL